MTLVEIDTVIAVGWEVVMGVGIRVVGFERALQEVPWRVRRGEVELAALE